MSSKIVEITEPELSVRSTVTVKEALTVAALSLPRNLTVIVPDIVTAVVIGSVNQYCSVPNEFVTSIEVPPAVVVVIKLTLVEPVRLERTLYAEPDGGVSVGLANERR